MNRRKPLALLFTDIASSTALACSMEPEDYADLLTAIRTSLQLVMDRHEGQIIRVDGDGALCMFGYTAAAEYAGKMAGLAALDFHAEVAAIARDRGLSSLNLHSGIHAGLVLLRKGDLVVGRYEVIGDATNVAARLCDAAGADEILISREALGGGTAQFAVGAARSITLNSGERGQARRIAAMPILGQQSKADIGVDSALTSGRIFGRESELARARTWLNAPAKDAPVFYIQADAGGGKSHLLRAIMDEGREANLRVAIGHCEEDYISATLQPMLQLVRDLAGEEALPDDLWQRQERIRAFIVDAAGETPLLLAIDDWQWSDDATKRLIEQCLTLAFGQIRLVIASRSDDSGLQGRKPEWTLGLSPLAQSESAEMASALAPHFDPQRVRKIHELSGGNPLLIEELCRDPEFVRAGATDERVCFRVAAVVDRRLAAMSPEIVDYLDYIAVCVGPVSVRILAELAGVPHTRWDDLIRRLEAVDFLHQSGDGAPDDRQFRYRHTLLKQAVQERMSLDRRRALHATIADHMLRHDEVLREAGRREQLAHHLLASNNELGLEFALSAGKSAMQAGSLDRAVGQYRRAIDFTHRNRHARDEVTVLRLANRFGAAVLLDPHVEHFAPLDQLQAIAEQQGLSSIKGRLLYWKASLHYATGRPDEARAVLSRPDFTQMFAEAGLPVALVTALHGQLGVLMAKHRNAAKQMDAAIAGLENFPNPAYDNSLAYMLLMRAQLRGEQGYFVDAARDFGRAEQLMQVKDQPLYASILTQKAGVALWAEDYAKVREYAAAGLHHGDRAGSRYYAILSRALDAAARGSVDARNDALEEMEHCLRWATHAQSGYTLSLVHSWAADLALRLGDAGRAAHHAHLCIGQGRHRLYWGAAQAWRVRATLASDYALAKRALTHAYVHARRMGSIREWAANLLADSAICARFGDEAKGHALRSAAEAMRDAIGLPKARLRLASEGLSAGTRFTRASAF